MDLCDVFSHNEFKESSIDRIYVGVSSDATNDILDSIDTINVFALTKRGRGILYSQNI